MAGKRAHAVVDSRAPNTTLHDPDADHAPRSATAGVLSAPPGDPAEPGSPYPGDDGPAAGGQGRAAFLTAPDGFPAVSGPGHGNGNGNGSFRAGGEPPGPAGRPTDVRQGLTAGALLPEVLIAPEAFSAQARPAAAWNASEVVTEIYLAHYKQLVRLAVVLVHDLQTAEEVVQDSFEAMHLAWQRLRNTEKALAYLRQAIVNKSRSELRHRKVVETHAPKAAPDEQSAEVAALTLIERSAVTSALRELPPRQREAIVLRYYGDFSEADIAKAMGISKGAVKSHTARAMASLKLALQQGTQ